MAIKRDNDGAVLFLMSSIDYLWYSGVLIVFWNWTANPNLQGTSVQQCILIKLLDSGISVIYFKPAPGNAGDHQ